MRATQSINQMTAIKKYDADHRTIRVDYNLSASPEKVWRALTEPNLLERWLFPNDIVPRVGQPFTFHTMPAPGFDGLIQCQITEAEPARRLVYSWRSGPLDTVVTWGLEPTSAASTRLSLTHEGFGPQDGDIYQLLEKGWGERSAGLLEGMIPSLSQ